MESKHSDLLREMEFQRESRQISDNGNGDSTFYASKLVPVIFLTDEIKKHWSLLGEYDQSITTKLLASGTHQENGTKLECG